MKNYKEIVYTTISKTYLNKDTFIELLYNPEIDKTVYQVWSTDGDGYEGDELCKGNLLTYKTEKRNKLTEKYNKIIEKLSNEYSQENSEVEL